MVDETITNENMNLMEQQTFVLKDLIEQQEETAESTSKFQTAVSKVGSDIRGGVNKKIEGIKSDVASTIKNVPDMLAATMDPLTGTLLKGLTSTVKKIPTAASYAKGLFSNDNEGEKKKGRLRETKREKIGRIRETKSDERTNENLTQIQTSNINQNEHLTHISTNTSNTQNAIENLVSIMRGDRLDKLEERREKSRADKEMIAAIEGAGAGAALGAGGDDDEEDGRDEDTGIFDKLKEKFLEITGAGAILGTALSKFKTSVSNVGKSIGAAGRTVAKSAAAAAKATGRGALSAARVLGGGRGRAAAAGVTAAGSAVKNLLGSSPKPSGAPPRPGGPGGGTKVRVPKSPKPSGGGGAMAKAGARYPKLLKFAKFIRGVPGLNVLAAGVEGILLASDDEMPPEQKKEELARILGGALGGAGGAKLGTILGTLAFPGLGTIAGTLAGGVGGYFLGGYAAKKIAGTLLEKPESGSSPIPNGNTSRLGGQNQEPSVGGTRQNTQNVNLGRAQADRQAATAQNRASPESGQGNVNVSAPTNINSSSSTVVKPLPSPSRVPQNTADLFYGAGAGVSP
jgi:hypothetical protein